MSHPSLTEPALAGWLTLDHRLPRQSAQRNDGSRPETTRSLLIGSLALLISRYRGSEFVVITCTESGATNSPGVGTATRLRINDQLSGGAFLALCIDPAHGIYDNIDTIKRFVGERRRGEQQVHPQASQ